VKGGELFTEIERRKSFNEETAANIISQLLSAIVYCHERGVVHRDLKPENILLDPTADAQLNIKVIDFGTAQMFNTGSKMKTTMGTAYYIAPEVLMKNYNEKCDVWSCGVILYILLSGTPPFNGNTDEEIMKSVRKTKFTFYSNWLLTPPNLP
jgi:calcium-dependent protein kinase